jgi:hypothetical protein
MSRHCVIAASLSLLLAGCAGVSSGPPPICGFGCPPIPVDIAVAERGTNEIALYPGLLSGSPTSLIPIPGAESLAVADMFPSSTTESPVLYVGEYPAKVAILDTPYTQVSSTITAGISDPAALAVSTIDGYEALFVANRGANDVTIYESQNLNFLSPTFTIGGLDAPDGLAFDLQGNLWVAEASNVVEFAPPFTASSTPALTISSGLKSPSGITFDQNSGTMYVADKGNNAIVVYAAASVTPSLTLTNGVDGPGNLFIPSQSETLYVPNVAGNSAVEFSLPLTSTSQPFTSTSSGMNEPSAVTFMP